MCPFPNPPMPRMAWFKKERKPRTSERVKLEIPADAWEKCDECGHIDIKERFVRALNVCPKCGHHRRISAQEYIDLLVDEGSWHELDVKLRSADPLTFESYKERVKIAYKKAGELDAVRTGYARLHGQAVDLTTPALQIGPDLGWERRRAGGFQGLQHLLECEPCASRPPDGGRSQAIHAWRGGWTDNVGKASEGGF